MNHCRVFNKTVRIYYAALLMCIVPLLVPSLAQAQFPPDTSRVIQQSNTTVTVNAATTLPGTVVSGPSGLGPGDANNPREPQDGVFTDIVRFNDGTQRFLASTLGGNVHILNGNGVIQTSAASPLLNAVQTGNSATFNFRLGLNSIALHPDFATPGAFGFGKAYGFASQDFTSSSPAPTFTPFDSNGLAPGGGFSHDSVLFEYDLSSIVGNVSATSVTSPAAPRELLRIRQPGGSHNGFDLAFRSDGQLFASVGDGTASSFSADNGLRLQLAQNIDSVYGSLLRINPDPNAAGSTQSANGEYSIPNDNPFVGQQSSVTGNNALPEIYANGFRSPFRISVNPENEDEVFLGDVGNGGREEVSRVIAGGNYGWGIREGGTALGGSPITVQVDGSTTLIGPEFEYARTNFPNTGLGQEGGGVAVIGGFTYEGSLFDGLTGQYIGAELGNFQGSTSLARVYFGQPDGDLFNSSQEPSAFAISDDSDVFDNVNLGDRGLPNIITGLVEGFNGEIFAIGLEGTTVPGVDESGGNGDLDPGNLVIARLLPEGGVADADFDDDGSVDGADFLTLQQGVGTLGFVSSSIGDANLDNSVDQDDLAIFLAQFGDPGTSPPQAASAVPEPSSLGLLSLAMIAGFARRRHKC